MAKRLFILVAVCAMMFGGSGCMSWLVKPKPEPIDKRCVKYMEERYGETFTSAGPIGNSMTGNYSMYVTCNSLPDCKITVTALNFNKPDCVFQDNYLVHKYNNEIADLLKKFAMTEFSEANVYVTVTSVTLTENISESASVEEVIRDSSFMLSATVEVKEHEFIEAAQAERVMLKMGEDLCGKELTTYHVMFISVEEDNFGKLSNSELSQAYMNDTYTKTAKIQKWATGSNTVWKEAEE